MKKLSNPYVFIGVLLLTVIVSGLMCNITTANTNNTNSIMVANGSTVVSGDLLIDTQNMKKVPLFAEPGNILRPIKNRDFFTAYMSLITGAAPKDVIKNNSYITANGRISSKLDGPAKVNIDENGKVSLNAPKSMIWGYKLPYTVAVKNGDSINLVQNNKTIKTLKESEINNDTVPTDFVSANSLKTWFETANDGNNVTVDYYLGNFNDNRTGVYGEKNISHLFGNDTYTYMRNYTAYAPVLVYEHNATENEISNATSTVRDLAGYPTQVRAANAKEFANGWNNTIVPPHSTAHGKENVSFTPIVESEATSGSATHGVCPAGRSLRDAIVALGNPLPVGMSAGDEAILYEYRPTIDVAISNNRDYPIKVVMWSEGDGGSTQIFTKIYELKDNATYTDTNSTSNSTSDTDSTNESSV